MKKLMFLLMAVLVMSACNKDDDDTNDSNPTTPTLTEQIVGTYTFGSAIFNNPIIIHNAGDTTFYEAGDDASQFVEGGLLGAAPCDNADNAALDLRSNFTSFYVCIGESNELQMGTWALDEATLKLSLNITNPAPFSIPMEDIDLTDDVLTGQMTLLPVPKDMSQPISALNIQFANVAVSFAKIN